MATTKPEAGVEGGARPEDVLAAGIYPPPYTLRTEPETGTIPLTAEPPGTMKLDKSGRLLRTYLEFRHLNPFIAQYDNWIKQDLPRQVLGPYRLGGIFEPFYTFYFTDVRVTPPIFKGTIMTPRQARQNSRNYFLTVTANLRMYTYLPEAVDTKTLLTYRDGYQKAIIDAQAAGVPPRMVPFDNIKLCQIPLMVGSYYCVLHDKTPTQLVELGESPSDPFGYFIVHGESKGIQLQKNLRFNVPIISKKNKEKLLCIKMTCSTIRGTSNLKIKVGDSGTGLEINLQFMKWMGKTEYYPLFLIFDILWTKVVGTKATPSNLEAIILQFFRTPTDRIRARKILFGLATSSGKLDPLLTLISQRKEYKTRTPVELQEILGNMIVEDCFPQMSVFPSGSLEEYRAKYRQSLIDKMRMLAFMGARLIEYHLGSRPMDDVDDWGNVKIEAPPELLKQLFNNIWRITARNGLNSYLKALEKTLEKPHTFINPKDFADKLKSKDILDTFTRSLSMTDNWGVQKKKGVQGYKKTNVSTALPTESPIALLSIMTKVVSSVDANSSNQALRAIKYSQFGYIDPAQTPEGAKCGLVEHLTMTTSVTSYVDPQGILDRIRSDKSARLSIDYNPDYYSLIINGSFIGWCDPVYTGQKVREIRRKPDLGYTQTAVWKDDMDRTLYIYTNEGRLIRPLLILNNDEVPVVAEKDLWERDFSTLLNEGAVEYLDVKEHNYLMIAPSIEFITFRRQGLNERSIRSDLDLLEALSGTDWDVPRGVTPLTKRLLDNTSRDAAGLVKIRRQLRDLLQRVQNRIRYTHMELSPDALYGFTVGLSPYPGHSPSPRHTMQANMSQQALTQMEGRVYRTDTTMKTLITPTPPLVQTQMQQIAKLDKFGTGRTVKIMFLPFDSTNVEDAILVNKRSLELGLFRMEVTHTYEATLEKTKSGLPQEFARPTPRRNEAPNKYDYLNAQGLPRIGTKLKADDVVIGRVIRGDTKQDTSIKVKVGEHGVVESVIKSENENSIPMVRVKLRQVRIPQFGDKLAARYSQKGTIGAIVPPEDLPFTEDGQTPDLVINPHAIPSRMTIGFLIEVVAGNIAAVTGEKQDATLFKRFNEADFMRELVARGFTRAMKTRVFWGSTGIKMDGLVTFGPAYYLLLKHLVEDKVQARGMYGPTDYATKMPMKSRAKRGGLKIGDMERAALIIHGGADIINLKMCHDSNPINLTVCKRCGANRVTNPRVSYMCNVCGLQSTTGKGFTRTTVRYTAVYAMNLLATAGLNVRLITSEK